MKEEMLVIVNGVLKEEGIEITSVQEDEDLFELGVDSILFVQIVVALEEKFKLEISDDKLIYSELNTFNKIFEVFSNSLPEF